MSIDAIRPVITTPAVMAGSITNDLTNDQASISALENEVATCYSVTVASDNPAQAANILQLQAGVTRARKYETNAQDGVSWLSLANNTVGSVLTVLNQVESAVEGLSGYETTGNSAAVAGVGTVVTNARAQLIDLANTQYAGQAIFSGTGTPVKAYDATGNYAGAGAAPSRTVAPNSTVPISVTGPAIFGITKPTATPKSTGLLGPAGLLQQMATLLAKGTSTSITKVATTLLGTLQKAMANVESQAGTLGADQQAMESFSSQATASATALEQELAAAQDVTMAQALTNLQLQENSYQSALYVTSQLDGLSLVNYL
jgi:flagellar hook-associated protein 3 FlgL